MSDIKCVVVNVSKDFKDVEFEQLKRIFNDMKHVMASTQPIIMFENYSMVGSAELADDGVLTITISKGE
jgi:hypothetical protein